MDKIAFETLDYLPTNNTEVEPEQFFIVDDDGTYFINRQVQYIAQVQDVKEVLGDGQACTVYDVTPQQFFVDVENSSELISVSDQLIVPDGSNNLYGNSYLLQPGSSSAANQMEDGVDSQYKSSESSMDANVDTNSNHQDNYTEVTLSDKQYRLLEQKGWLLLEINDKVFILDTLGGLRDITSNDKLIQKLKSESENEWDNTSECVKIENDVNSFQNQTQSLCSQSSTVEFVIGDDVRKRVSDKIENLPFIISGEQGNTPQGTIVDNSEIESAPIITKVEQDATTASEDTRESDNANIKIFLVENDINNEHSQKDNIIRIKSKLSLKDIPEKIILGKTLNGKRLVAKLKKISENCVENKSNNIQNEASETTADSNIKQPFEIITSEQTNISNMDTTQFKNLIQQTLQNTNTKVHDFSSIEVVIKQLTQMSHLKPSIIDENLFITKIVQKEDSLGNVKDRSKPVVLTGHMKMIDNQWRFIYDSGMLQKLMAESVNVNNKESQRSGMITKNIVHVQILEVHRPDSSQVKTSITVNKQSLTRNENVKKMKTVYACSACASIFKLEQELKEHREKLCKNTENILPMDVDKLKKSNESNEIYIKSNKGKIFSCSQCNLKFNRLSNCKTHIKTHLFPASKVTSKEEKDSQNQNVLEKKTNRIYKCKMCPCTYFHPSTLSKHIMSRHIQKVISN